MPTGNACAANSRELAEQYCLNRLAPADLIAFEEHYLSCPACAELVERTDEFIHSLRAAVEPPMPEEVLAATAAGSYEPPE